MNKNQPKFYVDDIVLYDDRYWKVIFVQLWHDEIYYQLQSLKIGKVEYRVVFESDIVGVDLPVTINDLCTYNGKMSDVDKSLVYCLVNICELWEKLYGVIEDTHGFCHTVELKDLKKFGFLEVSTDEEPYHETGGNSPLMTIEVFEFEPLPQKKLSKKKKKDKQAVKPSINQNNTVDDLLDKYNKTKNEIYLELLKIITNQKQDKE